MSNQKATAITPRKILGFSLSPELAREVKEEAARRDLSLRALFEDLWTQYREAQSGKVKP